MNLIPNMQHFWTENYFKYVFHFIFLSYKLNQSLYEDRNANQMVEFYNSGVTATYTMPLAIINQNNYYL